MVERELLVLDGFLNSEGWPFADVEVQVLGVLAEGFGVDGCEVDFAFVFFGDGLQFGDELLALFGGLGEDVT